MKIYSKNVVHEIVAIFVGIYLLMQHTGLFNGRHIQAILNNSMNN